MWISLSYPADCYILWQIYMPGWLPLRLATCIFHPTRQFQEKVTAALHPNKWLDDVAQSATPLQRVEGWFDPGCSQVSRWSQATSTRTIIKKPGYFLKSKGSSCGMTRCCVSGPWNRAVHSEIRYDIHAKLTQGLATKLPLLLYSFRFRALVVFTTNSYPCMQIRKVWEETWRHAQPDSEDLSKEIFTAQNTALN